MKPPCEFLPQGGLWNHYSDYDDRPWDLTGRSFLPLQDDDRNYFR
ncbi:hypothetical protein [Stenomitos frigidus]|nr:hypothetical protein [Stenomitos frigidus]